MSKRGSELELESPCRYQIGSETVLREEILADQPTNLFCRIRKKLNLVGIYFGGELNNEFFLGEVNEFISGEVNYFSYEIGKKKE